MTDFASFLANEKRPSGEPLVAPEPAQAPADFASFLKQTHQDDTLQRARVATVVNAPQSAEQAAAAAKIVPFVGLPQAAVETDLPRFQAQAKAANNAAMLEGNPLLAKWVADNPDSARIAQDEYDKLGKLEKMWKGGNDLSLALFQGMGGATNQAILAVNRALGVAPEMLDRIADTHFGEWWYRNMVEPQEMAAGAFQPENTFGAKTAHAIGSLLTMMSQVTLTGGPAAEAAIGLKEMAKQSSRQMVFPSLVAAVNTGHDVYANTNDAGAATRAAIGAYLTTTMQGIVPLSVPGGLVQRMATGAVSGAVTGEVQRVAMNTLLPENMQTQFNPEEMLFQAIQGAMLGGVLGPRYEPEMYRAIRETYTKGTQAERTEQVANRMLAAGQMLEGTKLRDAAPEQFKQFVDAVSESGDVREVWVGARPLSEAFAQSGVDPAQIPGLQQQIKEGLLTGGDVRIPVADYLTHLSGTPVEKAILPEMKAEAGGMTFAESQSYFQTDVTAMKAAAQAIADAKQKREMDERAGQAVRDDVARQLMEANRFPEAVNKAYADMARAFYETQAQRMGMTPEQLYAEAPLRIVAEDVTARPEALIQHRKRVSILQSIVECLS